MTADLERRLTLIEDRTAISELRALYCYLVDQGRASEAVELFTEDCEFHGPVRSFFGRDEQFRHYNEHPLAGMWHFIFNELISVSGETATAQCYCYMPCVSDGESYICSCQYDDILVKRDGRWMFKSRVVTFHYFVPLNAGWAGERMLSPTG